MNDEELLNYALLHSQTERALFHRDHVKRIYDLARIKTGVTLPEWVSVDFDQMEPLVELARKRMRQPKLTLVP